MFIIPPPGLAWGFVRDSFIYAAFVTFICATHLYVWLSYACDSLMCVTHSCVASTSILYSLTYNHSLGKWLIRENVTHSWQIWLIRGMWLLRVWYLKRVMHSHVYVCGIRNSRRLTHMCGMMLGDDRYQFVTLSYLCNVWLIHVCDMTQSCVWHDSFICVIWFTCLCDILHGGWWILVCYSFISVMHPHVRWHSWFNYTHSGVWHHARGIMNISSWLIYICGSLIHMCDMAHSYVWHDSFIYVWHDSLICMT